MDNLTTLDIHLALSLMVEETETWADTLPSDFLLPYLDLPNVQTLVFGLVIGPFRVPHRHIGYCRPRFQEFGRQVLRPTSTRFIEATVGRDTSIRRDQR